MLLVWAHEGLHEHCTMCNKCYSKLSKPFELISKTWDFFFLLHMLFNAKSKTCKFYYVMRPTSRSLLLLILNWHWELNRQKSVDKGMFTRGKKNIHLSLPFPDRQLGCHSAWCVCKFNMCSPCPLPQYHDIFRHTLHRCCTAQFFGICSTCLHTASHSTPVNSHPLIFEAAWRTAK